MAGVSTKRIGCDLGEVFNASCNDKNGLLELSVLKDGILLNDCVSQGLETTELTNLIG